MNRWRRDGSGTAPGAVVIGACEDLAGTLASIEAQSLHPAWIAVWSDDGKGTDGLGSAARLRRSWEEIRTAAGRTPFVLFAEAGDLWYPDHAQTCLHLVADGASVGAAPPLFVRPNGLASVLQHGGQPRNGDVLTFAAVQGGMVRDAPSPAELRDAVATAPVVEGWWPTAVHFPGREKPGQAVRSRWVRRVTAGLDRDLVLAQAMRPLVAERAKLDALVEARTAWAQRAVGDVLQRDAIIRELQRQAAEQAAEAGAKAEQRGASAGGWAASERG